MSADLPDEFRESARQRLKGFTRQTLGGEGLAPAAVDVVLLPNRPGRPCFLLTRRAATLRRHAGQWALPGGRRDPGEPAAAAAVRELGEELGVPASEVEVAGELDDYVTRSGYVITPVVLLAAPIARLRPNLAEVAAAYRVPLEVLAVPMPQKSAGGETVRYRVLGRVLNPPTAAILHQLAELVLNGRTVRVGHFAQPEFTWR